MNTLPQPQSNSPSAKKGLVLALAWACLGIGLIPAFFISSPGFPDNPPNSLITLLYVVYFLFCVTEGMMIYHALTISGWIRNQLIKIFISVVMGLGVGFLQLTVLILAVLVWPLWVLSMLLVIIYAAWKLSKLNQ